ISQPTFPGRTIANVLPMGTHKAEGIVGIAVGIVFLCRVLSSFCFLWRWRRARAIAASLGIRLGRAWGKFRTTRGNLADLLIRERRLTLRGIHFPQGCQDDRFRTPSAAKATAQPKEGIVALPLGDG